MDVVEKSQVDPGAVLNHWYYRAKFELLASTIKQSGLDLQKSRIADVGCGLGIFLSLLETELAVPGDQLVGIDPAFSEAGRAIGGTARIFPAWPNDYTADLLLLMDVLEHTPDDCQVLSESVARVRPGGQVFITVPAFQRLWSSHDRFLGHYRRYTMDMLTRLIHRVPGLRIKNLHYYFAAVLPIAVPRRLWQSAETKALSSDLKELPPIFNALCRKIMAFERIFASSNRLAGLTVVAFCEKTGEDK